MFDIGFWELCLIAVVALLILGPERLPVAARTAGLWIGKARRMIGNVKEEIDRELQLDEIRKKIQEGEESIRETSGLSELKNITDNTIADIKSFEEEVDEFNSELQDEDDSKNDSSHDYEPLPRSESKENQAQSILDFAETETKSEAELEPIEEDSDIASTEKHK